MKTASLAIGLSSILACAYICIPYRVKAYETDYPLCDEDNERTEGLLSRYYLTADKSGGDLLISGYSKSSSSMASIGFTDISIQRSYNGTSWTEEKTINDILINNSSNCTLSGYPVDVLGGYYYRVCVNHYADNGSGTTQTISNTSNSVWIS